MTSARRLFVGKIKRLMSNEHSQTAVKEVNSEMFFCLLDIVQGSGDCVRWTATAYCATSVLMLLLSSMFIRNTDVCETVSCVCCASVFGV